MSGTKGPSKKKSFIAAVIARDNGVCRVCGGKGPVVCRITPLSLMPGGNVVENGILLCWRCKAKARAWNFAWCHTNKEPDPALHPDALYAVIGSSIHEAFNAASANNPNKRPHCRDAVFDNIEAYGPDGRLMCHLTKKKRDWYLERGLAQKLSDAAIRFTFKPAGSGSYGLYVEKRENKCCVCGRDNSLTLHHVVPYCYTKHLTFEQKRLLCHDLMPMCWPCHRSYESQAMHRKKVLHKTQWPGADNNGRLSAISAAYALARYSDQIPLARKSELTSRIAKHLGKDPSQEEIADLAFISRRPTDEARREKRNERWSKIIKDIIDSGLDEFIIGWRKHFIETAKPKFLPAWYDPTRTMADLEKEAGDDVLH